MKKLYLCCVLLFPFQTILFSNPVKCDSQADGVTSAFENNKHRVWLNLTNTEGLFKQILIAYVEGATNGWDHGYDAITMDANRYADFYTINEGQKLAIQGRALPFTLSDIVALGYRSAIAGELTISIDHADGNLINQNIYVEDKKTGAMHNLRKGSYTFSSSVGTFTERFVIRYSL